MATVVVLGGGISGLAATHYLSSLSKDAVKKIILVERSARLGGWIRSTRFPDGAVFEHGQHFLRPGGESGNTTLRLVEELGLSNQVLSTRSATSRHWMLLGKGRVTKLPTSLGGLLWPGNPFKIPLIFPVFKDAFWTTSGLQDETVDQFTRRRFNGEVADYIMDPLTRNLCGGSSREISMQALLPQVFQAVRNHGSVVRGQLRQIQRRAQSSQGTPGSRDVTADHLVSQSSTWTMWSLRHGLQQLCDTLVERLGQDPRVRVYENEHHIALQMSPDSGRLKVSFAESSMEADHVFSCIPARKLSQLLIHDLPDLASKLLTVPTVHVASVNLEYKGKVLSYEAPGLLVPSCEDPHLLGILFDSCCFPQHDCQYENKTRITCLLGGRWFKQLFGDVDVVDPDVMLDAAKESVKRHLGIAQEPVRYSADLLKECLPQYLVGHTDSVSRMHQQLKDLGLHLTLLGASYGGLGVNERIHNARLAVQGYLEGLQS